MGYIFLHSFWWWATLVDLHYDQIATVAYSKHALEVVLWKGGVRVLKLSFLLFCFFHECVCLMLCLVYAVSLIVSQCIFLYVSQYNFRPSPHPYPGANQGPSAHINNSHPSKHRSTNAAALAEQRGTTTSRSQSEWRHRLKRYLALHHR